MAEPALEPKAALTLLDAWDPLAPTDDDVDMFAAAQKREIRNILKSYTGYYDLFSEMIQNALDAVEKRFAENVKEYRPTIAINIDLQANSVSVTDNGCSMSIQQFKRFLKPNFSFKDGPTRGSKGVGATYLAFGFNHLQVATKPTPGTTYAGILKDGRTWLDDTKGIIPRPTVEPLKVANTPLDNLDRGTSIALTLTGENIRPKSLQYFIAKHAAQWLCLLRAHTPLGGLYLCGDNPPVVKILVDVISEQGEKTSAVLDSPRYLFPHEVLGKTADLREFLKDQAARAEKNQDISKIPPKFANLNGMWGEWTAAEIVAGTSPLNPVLDPSEKDLMHELAPRVYVFMCYTTDLWDDYNDNILKLRKGSRILRGGLQQATKHMPQGHPIPIPLTNNIGFQQITHVVVHFQNAEPDLGRKGFQPEHTALAETLSRAGVTAFRKFFDRLLRKNTGAPALMQQMKLNQWIEEQKHHELEFPLTISGKGLFAPQFELPIRSAPLVEQDVVALFNQMLSSGLIRGIQLLSSSQFNQYDGLFRFRMEPPFDLFIRSDQNPLGVDAQQFAGVEGTLEAPVAVLEYKHTMDALIEELDNGTKKADEIKLAICWHLGDKWRSHFDTLSYLDSENLHHRQFHGITHHFSHAVSGLPAFSVIVLSDLIAYLTNQDQESTRQHELYSEEK